MANVAPTMRKCGECGRAMPKVHRCYQGRNFCGTCYARMFKPRACSKCGKQVRLFRDDSRAVCPRCEYTGKPCVRCGKPEFEIGKLTAYGPACNSCSPYFREPKPCAACGILSPKLSRVRRLGIDVAICPKCQKADYASCSACGKHRLLEETVDGKRLCKKCRMQGMIPCPACGKTMAAGCGKECEQCYYQKLLEKRTEMDCASFACVGMAELFRHFGHWLGNEVGTHKAAITLHRHLDFFQGIEAQWGAVPEYEILLERYATLALRRKELPMRFLAQRGLVAVNEEVKQEHSDKRRIAAQLDRLPVGSPERKILVAYLGHLNERVKTGVSSVRSVRLAMSPAAGLLLGAKTKGHPLPKQDDLVNYLANTPGQRAAVSGFVGFLRKRYGAELSLPHKKAPDTKKRRQKLEAQLLALLRSDGSGKVYARKLLGSSLAYFHGLPKMAFLKATSEDVLFLQDEAGVIFRLDGQEYWLPREVEKALRSW